MSTVAQQLDSLESAGLVAVAQRVPELAYLFRHALMQDAAYLSLLKANRRELHRAVGDTLERLYPDRLDELAGTLAHHYQLAEEHAKALAYFSRAAQRAQAGYANAEALNYYREAIGEVEKMARDGAPFSRQQHAQLAQLHEQRGDVQELTGRLDEAAADFASAAGHTPQTEPVAQARLQRKIGAARGLQLRHAEAGDAFAQAEQALDSDARERGAGWWHEWIKVRLERMELHYRQAQWREIAPLVEQTRPAIERYGTPELRYYFYDSLIGASERRDRYIISNEILAYARALLAAAEESGNPRLVALGHFQLGFCLLWHGSLDEAEAAMRQGEERLRRVGDAIWLMHTLTYLGILYRLRGQPEQARPYIAEAREAALANKVGVAVARAEANRAWLAWRAANREAAHEHALAARELWVGALFVDPFQWTGNVVLLAASLLRNDFAESVRCARAMLDGAQQRLPDAIDGPLEQAVQYVEQGHADIAQTFLRKAVAAAERVHYL